MNDRLSKFFELPNDDPVFERGTLTVGAVSKLAMHQRELEERIAKFKSGLAKLTSDLAASLEPRATIAKLDVWRADFERREADRSLPAWRRPE